VAESLTIGTAGGNKEATEIWVGTSGGNAQVTEGWVGTASGNKQFYALAQTLSVTATAQFGQWQGNPLSTMTDTLTAVGAGGTPPYTYSWSVFSDPNGYASVDSAASAITGVSLATSMFSPYSVSFQCDITDALLNTASLLLPITVSA
jgi:hypothetical protein